MVLTMFVTKRILVMVKIVIINDDTDDNDDNDDIGDNDNVDDVDDLDGSNIDDDDRR